jgi:predicted MPP superfamily phosphohydrolase
MARCIKIQVKHSFTPIRVLIAVFIIINVQFGNAQSTKNSPIINMAFTSDVHYGLTKSQFRGDTGVTSHSVNAAMIAQINALPSLILPNDKGVGAGSAVGGIDDVVITGDIANRMEDGVQTAAASWKQFSDDYLQKLNLKGHNGQPAQLLLVPGNHDVSNAIGIGKLMKPLTDPTSMVGIYNLMLKPAPPVTNKSFDYAKNKVNYSRSIGGVHMVFITIWPDSAERVWLQKDLDTVAKTTPVIIFTHDPPTADPKHFTNPLPPYNMTAENDFENLLSEHYKEGTTAGGKKSTTDTEQRGFVKFLKAHSNIKAYFHGHNNNCEFYTYTGPNNDVNLSVFRSDSPMKGKYSAKDEKLLSFQLISLDPATQQLTVRECLWNTEPTNKTQKVVFGKVATVSLRMN